MKYLSASRRSTWTLTQYSLTLVVLAIVQGFSMVQAETQWHDASVFQIEGKGWSETTGLYERLPAHAKGKVTGSVWHLAKDSAGLAIRFETDAPSIFLRWSVLKSGLAMPHMPATGVSGVDVYSRNASGKWEFIANGRPHQQEGNEAEAKFPDGARPNRECLVYLPLYNGTTELKIGVPEGSTLSQPKPRPEDKSKPILVYGTSIAQGGCASRPGLAWPAIMGRILDRPVINLGFSGSGKMEPDTTKIISEVDASLFVIDCIWNIGDNDAAYQANVPALVQAIRQQHPETPILFVGQSHLRTNAHPTPATQSQESAVKKLADNGVKNLYLFPGDNLIGDDTEGTVDGVHPNDIGMLKQAQVLAPKVREILEGPAKVSIYIDTDLAAEVDDCYAVYRALNAPEFDILGISAMGWEGPLDFATNTRASLKMIEEMLDILKLRDKISHPLGALHPMQDKDTPVDSDAARDIIAKAHSMPPGEKLQVFVLGAYTNIASALLLDPTIADKITVLVMGYRFDDQQLTPTESNTRGDLHAAEFLLRSNVELKTMVNSTLRYFQWTKKEIDAEFKGKGGLRDYVVNRWESYSPQDVQRTVWDIAVFEAVLRPELATGRIIDHHGRPIFVWTAVDIPGMKSDFWEAAEKHSQSLGK